MKKQESSKPRAFRLDNGVAWLEIHMRGHRLSPMFSYVRPLFTVSSATAFFHLPIDEDEEEDIIAYTPKYITWLPGQSNNTPSSSKERLRNEHGSETIQQILATDELYTILAIPKYSNLDKTSLRRAYLSRSKACHPE